MTSITKDDTSAGLVKIELSADATKFFDQIKDASKRASTVMSKELGKDIDASKLIDTKGLERQLKALGETLSALMKDNTKAIDIMSDSINGQLAQSAKNAQSQFENLGDTIRESLGNQTETAAKQASKAVSQVKLPKLTAKWDQEGLNDYADNLAQRIDMAGAQAHQAKLRLDKTIQDFESAKANWGQLQGSMGLDPLRGFDSQPYEQAIAKAQDEFLKLDLKAQQLGQEMKAVNAEADKLAEPLKKADEAIKPLATSFNYLGREITVTAGKAMEMYSNGEIGAKKLVQLLNNMGYQADASRLSPVTEELKQIGRVGKTATASTAQGLKDIGSTADFASASARKLQTGLKKALRFGMAMIGVRSVMLGVRRATQSVSENFRRMAHQNGAFANQLNALSRASDTLKGSFASMVAPLAQYVIPVLERMIQTAVRAFNAIARVIGALSGKKTIMQAVGSTKQYVDNLGSATGAAGKATKANEKLKRSLRGFDDLEILTHQDTSDAGGGGGGGGGGLDPGVIFEEVDTGLGNLMDRFNDIFGSIANSPIWQRISQSATEAWNHVATRGILAWESISHTWNTNAPILIDNLKRTWSQIGTVLSHVTSSMVIPHIAGFVGAGIDIGESLINGIIETVTSLTSLARAMFDPFLNSVIGFFEEHGERLKEIIYEAWNTAGGIVKTIIGGLFGWIKTILDASTAWFREHGAEIQARFTETWTIIWNFLEPLWTWIIETGKKIWGELQAFFEVMSPKIQNVVTKAWDLAWKIIKPIWDAINKTARQIFSGLQAFWEKWGGNIQGFFGSTWSAIKVLFSGALDAIANIFDIFIKVFEGDWEGAWEGVKNLASGIWETIKKGWEFAVKAISSVTEIFGVDFKAVWNSIKVVATSLIEFIQAVFAGDWAGAWEAVKVIFANIWEGIKAIFARPINWVTEKINSFLQWISSIRIPGWISQLLGLSSTPFSVSVSPNGFNSDRGDMRPMQGNEVFGPPAPGATKGYSGGWAKGGIITQPTVGLVGEDGAEAVIPLQRNLGWLDALADKIATKNLERSSGGGVSSGNVTIPVYLGTDTLIDVIEQAVDRESRIRNGAVFS